MRHRSIAAAIAVLLAALASAPVSAADGLTATRDGTPITLAEARSLSCNDFEYPRITCFSTAGAARLTARTMATARVAAPAGSAALSYVTVYEHAGYAGAFLMLSSNQAWLSSIGWNDRISSFKSVGATGSFREDSPSGGFIYYFGPTTTAASLSGTYNDKFSAFYRN